MKHNSRHASHSPTRKHGQLSSAKQKKRKSSKEKDRNQESTKRVHAKVKMEQAERSSDEINLAHEIKPLAEYVSDQPALVTELFKSVTGETLNSLIPPVFKNCSLSELKKLCIEQLRVMSKKRILHILAGEEMMSSSGTEDENEKNIIPESAKVLVGPKLPPPAPVKETQQADSTCLELSDECVQRLQEPAAMHNEDSVAISPNALDNSVVKCDATTGNEALDLCPDQDELDSLIQDDRSKDNLIKQKSEMEESSKLKDASENAGSWVRTFTKTQMEILELELRARAIRSLMKGQGLTLADYNMIEKSADIVES